MPTPSRELLDKYRSTAKSEREKGTYFERLTKVWLETAPALVRPSLSHRRSPQVKTSRPRTVKK